LLYHYGDPLLSSSVHQGGWPRLLSTKPFYDPKEFHIGTILHATSFAALTYLGFDAVTTLEHFRLSCSASGAKKEAFAISAAASFQ
jgi:hypothetical protein